MLQQAFVPIVAGGESAVQLRGDDLKNTFAAGVEIMQLEGLVFVKKIGQVRQGFDKLADPFDFAL